MKLALGARAAPGQARPPRGLQLLAALALACRGEAGRPKLYADRAGHAGIAVVDGVRVPSAAERPPREPPQGGAAAQSRESAPGDGVRGKSMVQLGGDRSSSGAAGRRFAGWRGRLHGNPIGLAEAVSDPPTQRRPSQNLSPYWQGQLDEDPMSEQPDPGEGGWWDVLSGVAGGTGATISGVGRTRLDRALLKRMQYQDKAVMIMLLCAYLGSLLFSASLAYRQAANNSPVTFYADPRYHDIVVDSDDVEGFLEAFNQAPKSCHLQITGLSPMQPLPDYIMHSAVEWLGAQYRVSFSFALDLSPWMVRQGSDGQAPPPVTAGIAPEDLELLASWVAHDTNDLSCLHLHKEVDWKGWEELAVNIKTKIRQAGFQGVVTVRRVEKEVVAVHKNRPWANFMHSKTMKVLCALSLVGWLIYNPYMWIRHRATTIRCKYRIDLPIDQFWPHIAEGIGPDGFQATSDVPRG